MRLTTTSPGRGLGCEVQAVDTAAVAPSCDARLPVDVSAPAACPRYLGRVLRGVDTAAGTPLWMRERLRRSGLRSIDPVVDVTNYVMLELGQPMHAFDLARIRGGIEVRLARPGEQLVLLDGQRIELEEDVLVIADQERPLALAGIMGGEDSGVSADTRDIFLESAFFSPDAIAGRARRYGLHTDSSHRFERGVDPRLAARAMERATALLREIVGGEPGPVMEACHEESLPRRSAIRLRGDRIRRLLGMTVPEKEVGDILRRLDCRVSGGDGEWHLGCGPHLDGHPRGRSPRRCRARCRGRCGPATARGRCRACCRRARVPAAAVPGCGRAHGSGSPRFRRRAGGARGRSRWRGRRGWRAGW